MAAICVFCSASDLVDARYTELATQVGAELGRRGHTLVSGGGSVGLMGAVARAARRAGARTVGVIPRALADLEVADHDAHELVVTDDMRSRKAAMDARSDAFLVLPGGLGTLEEMLEIWVAGTLGMHGKPLAVLDPDDLFGPLRAQAELLVERGFARREAVDAVSWARTVPAAFAALAGAVPPHHGTDRELLEAEP